MLAVVWAINKFYKYLAWRPFVLITDYSALKYIKGNPLSWKGRIFRWVADVQQYNFEIQFRSGKDNTNADTLSRIPRNNG